MPFTVVVPCAGALVTVTPVATPLMEPVRSIAVAVPVATEMIFADTVGAPGGPTVKVAVAGGDVPPGPVAA